MDRQSTSQDWVRLGEQITRARLARVPRWFRKDLAEATGLTARTLGSYERGVAPRSAPRIPDGYMAVAQALGWTSGSIEDVLAGGEPTTVRPRPSDEASRTPAAATTAALAARVDPAVLYQNVVGFGRLCVQRGADPRLRDLMEEAAERLLASIPGEAPVKATDLELAAYRPHGWAEGDPAVPADDAERIRRALEDYDKNR